MTPIITELNSILNANTITRGIQLHGICELAIKDNQPHPVSIVDKKQVAPNDRYEGIIYHRVLNDALSEAPDYSFGSKMERQHNQVVRMVVMIKFAKGKEWIDQFINVIPQTIDGLTDYKLVNINNIQKNTNQDEIYRTEFGDSGYEKHRLAYHIYALEYTVEHVLCV